MSCKYSLNINLFGLLKCVKHCREELTECHPFFCFLCSRQKIELPLMENVQTIPPPYVVRTVLIYSRHAGQLQFNPSEAFSVSLRITDASKSGWRISTSLLWPSLHHQGAIKVLWGALMSSYTVSEENCWDIAHPYYICLVSTVHLSLKLTCSCVLLQKMLQSPYFFFDVVYLHNGVEEQGDETSWRVSKSATIWQ